MKKQKFKSASDVKLKLTTKHNLDDVQLTWRTLDTNAKDSPLENCLGFMIQRQRMKEGGWEATETLRNRVGFSETPIDPKDPKELSRPSIIWPFQRYDWTDHGANNGQTVRYKISAVGLPLNGRMGESELTVLLESQWSAEITLSSQASRDIFVYFNRGTIMSQYVARIAREKNWSGVDIKKNIKQLKEPLRIFLSGELRIAMLEMLDSVIANPFLNLYAALYELSDTELIDKLCKIGKRAHVVLSDGSNSKKDADGKTVSIDGNREPREALKKAKVNVHDRILGKLGLGHNKIMISVDTRNETALSAWTGSTNWSSSGLCTQLNNGILFRKNEVAELFYTYWKVLRDAKDKFGPELMAHNGNRPKTFGNIDVWFTRTEKPADKKSLPIDIETIRGLISSAKESVLYTVFQPGLEPLRTIVTKDMDKNMYVRGVVSTVIESNRENFKLISDGEEKDYRTDLVQPEGVQQDFGWWLKETTRKQFIPGVGFAITHTKMIVIDAFGKDPIVITGSHNFSNSASQSNDENFVIIRGDRAVAEHYAVASMAIYSHYRWRAYLQEKSVKKEKIWSHLDSSPVWQASRLADERTISHLKKWC